MKVVLAIDSFKGSLSSQRAEDAVECGIKRAVSDADIVSYPIADGGEGLTEALIRCMNGKMKETVATDPLGRKISSEYAVADDGTAIIEMAKAAGITLVDKSELNPLVATTYGVGELIADAIKNGSRSFIVGLGGSAANDCGIGMLQALGFEFTDKDGKNVAFGANGVRDVCCISDKNAMPELSECEFRIACDVSNPLCGEKGASMVFAPQKGATPKMCQMMDEWFFEFAEKVKGFNPDSDMNSPGAGAAGGTGFALMSFLNARLESGIDMIIDKIGIENDIANADIVVTGEGRIDRQTVMGKVPGGVSRLAKKYGKTVLAFCGCVSDDARECNENGIDAFFPILRQPCSVEDAMDSDKAYKNLADTSEQVFRLIVK